MYERPTTIAEQELRPAKRQVGDEVLQDLGALRGEVDGSTEYNIWYNRWTGHRNNTSVRAQYKLNVRTDTGLTLGSKDKTSHFCMYFARGMCPHGSQCRFWHRLPTDEDKVSFLYDLFGRERHAQYRDDMGGVGSFSNDNKVLYVGRIAPYENTEEVIKKFFSPYGPIVKVNLLPSKSVAFVEYTKRIYAEFAKEAMSNQPLERNEIINVRWATEDALRSFNKDVDLKREAEGQVEQAMLQKLPKDYIEKIMFEDDEEFQEQEINNENKTKRLLDEEAEKEEKRTKIGLLDFNTLTNLDHISQNISYTSKFIKKQTSTAKIAKSAPTNSEMKETKVQLDINYSSSSE